MQITETYETGRPANYYLDGRRISRARWQALTDQAHRDGTLCCLSTTAKQLPGGRIRRRNVSIISQHPQR